MLHMLQISSGWIVAIVVVVIFVLLCIPRKRKPYPVIDVGKATVSIVTDGKVYTREFVGEALWNDAFGDVSRLAKNRALYFINSELPIELTDGEMLEAPVLAKRYIPRHRVHSYKLSTSSYSEQAKRS